MFNKISAWVLYPVLLLGMMWFLAGTVNKIMNNEKNDPGSIKTVSGWNKADSAVDSMLPWHDKALGLRTKLTIASGCSKIGDIYISRERLLREPKELDEAALYKTAESINSFYEKYSVPMCMALFPEAAEIYTECLPENVTVPSQLQALDRFYENVDTKIRTVDAFHILSTFKDDYIYYRTVSGCTANGAYVIYRSLIRKMGYYPVPYDSCTISHVKNDIRGDLYDVCLYDEVTPDMLDVYICEKSSNVVSIEKFDGEKYTEGSFYDEEAYKSGDALSFYIGKPCLLTNIKTDVENGKKLLVLKDCYGDSMLPFLTQHYAEIDAVDMSCLDRQVSDFLKPDDYQQVLILCDADTLTDTDAFRFLSGN